MVEVSPATLSTRRQDAAECAGIDSESIKPKLKPKSTNMLTEIEYTSHMDTPSDIQIVGQVLGMCFGILNVKLTDLPSCIAASD